MSTFHTYLEIREKPWATGKPVHREFADHLNKRGINRRWKEIEGVIDPRSYSMCTVKYDSLQPEITAPALSSVATPEANDTEKHTMEQVNIDKQIALKAPWIDPAEKLPKEREEVLILVRDPYVSGGYMRTIGYHSGADALMGWVTDMYRDLGVIPDVIGWTSLPKIPFV